MIRRSPRWEALLEDCLDLIELAADHQYIGPDAADLAVTLQRLLGIAFVRDAVPRSNANADGARDQ